MRVHLNNKSIDEVMLERFDELLGMEGETEMTDEEIDEMHMLAEWYDVFMDFHSASMVLESYYKSHGVEFVR